MLLPDYLAATQDSTCLFPPIFRFMPQSTLSEGRNPARSSLLSYFVLQIRSAHPVQQRQKFFRLEGHGSLFALQFW